MTEATVFPSLREAVHATATQGPLSMKQLASELDWAPSELSMRTTLGGDSARAFPADDEHLIKLMRLQKNYSVLATLADKCGFQLEPKKERLAEMVTDVRDSVERLIPRVQMLLEIQGLEYRPSGKGKK